MIDLEPSLLRTFVAVVETGRLTKAGQQVGRTQPAISHQLKRLEHMIGRPLFAPDRRHLALTSDGEILLHYARAMLRLTDEARARFNGPHVQGRVVLGTPDFYAAHLLPEIIGTFSRTHPGIEVELRCRRSVLLQNALRDGEIDLALVTRQPNYRGGQVIREEPMVWVSKFGTNLEKEATLPLAVLPESSGFRRHTLAALARAERRWRIVTVSDSIAGLQAAIFAGLAVAVFPACAVAPGMRCIGEREGLPKLSSASLSLLRRGPEMPAAATYLADYISREIGSIVAFQPLERRH
jgi:DNA-binding transcriptional LysR family regulator